MEPVDPPKNVEGSGFRKRRISSILKAPRKSTTLPDTEQQENEAEIAKPVEKRNSRRVSFAPANDVLLFANDIKNASPVRSPLQDLMTATATMQNRAQVVTSEDGAKQIMGIENLLNAPLHVSQQRDTVNFDSGKDFGEKTVMFSTDDALMDMTHSHTINIASDAELLGDKSLHSYNILCPGSERGLDDGSADMAQSHPLNKKSGSAPVSADRHVDLNAKRTTVSAALPCLDLEFEDFLASLSKPSGASTQAGTRNTPFATPSSVQTNSSMDQSKTQGPDIDKENQVPKSLNRTKIGQSFHRSVLCPEDDVGMDMTAAHTGCILGAGDDDPFQCPFPNQDMHAQSDKRVSQMAEVKGQRSSKTSTNPQEKSTLINPPLHALHQRHNVGSDPKVESRENTMMFTAGNDFMDITRSHTVNIANDSLAPAKMSADSFHPQFNDVFASLSKPSDRSGNIPRTKATAEQSFKVLGNSDGCLSKIETSITKEKWLLNTSRSSGEPPEDPNRDKISSESDINMDMTEAQTGRIIGLTESDDPFQFLLPLQDMHPLCESQKKADVTPRQQSSKEFPSSSHTGMENPLRQSLKMPLQIHQEKRVTEDAKEKTLRFSAVGAGMDLTRSHTVNIATAHKLQLHQNEDFSPTCREKTVRFSADDGTMDMTQCLTVNIASDLPSDSATSVKTQERPPLNGPSYTHGLDPGFNTPLTSLSNPNDHCANPVISRMISTAARSHDGCKISSEGSLSMDETGLETVNVLGCDVGMDMTEVHTGRIVEFPGRDDVQGELSTQDMNPHSSVLKKLEKTSNQKRKEALGPSNFTGVEFRSSLKKMPTEQVKFHSEDDNREKTVRFTAESACMDVTQSHTANIIAHLPLESFPHVDMPGHGEKTVRFTAIDAAMDVTRSHTVNISTDLNALLQQNKDSVPATGEKTVRFTAIDAAMDMTGSHTVNIISDLPQSNQNVGHFPADIDGTLKFTGNDAAMDVTKSHKTNIATDFKPKSHQNVGFMPICDINECLAVNTSNSGSDIVQLKTHRPDLNTGKEVAGFASVVVKKPENQILTDCPEVTASMDITAAQMGYISVQTSADIPSQSLSATQVSTSDSLNTTKLISQSNESLRSSSPDAVKVTNPADYYDSNSMETTKEHEPKTTVYPLSQEMESSPNAVDQDTDTLCSQTSRRRSLAKLQSKVRRLSHMINTAPVVPTDSCTAPLPQLDHDLNQNSPSKTTSLPITESEMTSVNTENNTQDQDVEQASDTVSATPFNLKTKRLMSALTVGGFRPKLPQRNNPEDSKKVATVGESTKTTTVDVTRQMNNFDDNDISDIYDEELGSYEDVSETLNTGSPEKILKKESPPQELNTLEPLEDDVLEEEFVSNISRQKRPLAEDEDGKQPEKRLKESTEFVEEAFQSNVVECDSNISTARSTSCTIDSSSSGHTASRCEAAFESTIKNSLFESQLEDYASDAQKKLEDGTITASEFFKLFNIDFVIHNPRQSVIPGRLLSEAGATPLDLLKDRHISRPKVLVYERDIQTLTEKVEGLKVRMLDLDKPLKTLNRPLWEQMRHSSEKELKSFGTKLKERNNFFRKTSKVQSHETKEVLYTNLARANLEERQKVKGMIEQAEEMVKSLDGCIGELEAELVAVDESGSEDKQSLKSLQEEMKKVTESLADNDKQIAELEIQKQQNSSKLNRLKAETRNLESHMDMLNTLNEWKFRETRNNCTVYTFLHETMLLQLVHEKSSGNDTDGGSELKTTNITFKLELNDEKSHAHARLVHKLIAQYVEEESAWVEKYPTSAHIPQLLHDVSLVVSSCRLLGEELRLLKMWGGLRLDILDISCQDTRVNIVFSSLKKFSKFEAVFAVSLTNHFYVLQLESFQNMIGSTTIQQIEEVVASFSPSRNLLTKIVKKIHDALLC
ncbi:uncharacterized protein knl1 [Cololabis saira]|uniref:uncharacterized protein knl1 n=1 Tax=Cololabis saira TaxID=129043 RepID=UPI002AD271FF|nr:uncharacterized protein knl1 [Cololabis saira]